MSEITIILLGSTRDPERKLHTCSCPMKMSVMAHWKPSWEFDIKAY